MEAEEIAYFQNKLTALLEATLELKKKNERLGGEKLRFKVRGSSDFSSEIVYINKEISVLKKEGENLIEIFNGYIEDLKGIVNFGDKKFVNIEEIVIESRAIISYFDSIKVPLKKEESLQIIHLRKRIKEIECVGILNKNLLYSLSELERGFALSSVLVSGRIISYCLDKIKGETRNEIIQSLEEGGEILLKENDKQGAEKSQIIKIIDEYLPTKKYRNFSSHNIHNFPEIEDAFKALSDAITLVTKIP